MRGLLQGLRKLIGGSNGGGDIDGQEDSGVNTTASSMGREIADGYEAPLQPNPANTTIDSQTLLHAVALRAVRTATGLLTPEKARELKAARRKLGLASLTISERKAKTDVIAKAVEVTVLIASFVRAILGVEEGDTTWSSESHKTAGKMPPAAVTTGTKVATTPMVGKAVLGVGEEARLEKMNGRRAAMVSTFEQVDILSEILKPLVDLEVGYGICAYSKRTKGSPVWRLAAIASFTYSPLTNTRFLLQC